MTINNLEEYWEDYYPGDATFEDDRASATIVYQFDWDDIEVTLPQIIGYSQKAGGSLSRTVPLAHPMFPWMYAQRITKFMPLGPDGLNSPAPSSQAAAPGQGLAFAKQSAWKKVRIWVQFEPLPYAVYTDAALPGANEFNRYVTKTINPRGEAVTMDKGSFIWSGASVPGGQMWTATSAPSCGVSKKVIKADLSFVWHKVPEDGAIDISTGLPTKQLALLGTVNVADFNGYPAQSLLLNSIKYSIHNFGVQPAFNVEQAARYYDIEYNMIYFTIPNTTPPGNTGGWNYLPDPAGGWTKVVSAVGANPLYPTGDWSTLFTLN